MAGNGSHHQPEPQAGDLPSWATAALDAATAALDAVPKNSEGSVESAQVRGPIPSGPVGDPSHNYPFFSARQDLASYGYTQGHRQSRVVVITSFLDRWSDAEEVEDLV